MDIRALTTDDLDAAMGLYRAMLDEYAADGERAHYPLVTPRTVDEMHAQMLQGLWAGGTRWYGAVAVVDDALVGVTAGEVYTRPVGGPKTVGHLYFLYVDPAHRGGAGRRSVALQLMREIGRVAMTDHPDLVLEASAVVGSRTEKTWQGLGFTPYQTFMAWVHPDGTPRQAGEFFERTGARHGG